MVITRRSMAAMIVLLFCPYASITGARLSGGVISTCSRYVSSINSGSVISLLVTTARSLVIKADATEEDRADTQERLDATIEAAAIEDADVDSRLIEGDEIAGTIIGQSTEHDVTIIGATRKGLLQQFVFGAISEAVGRRAENTVIMAKRNLDLSLRLTHLLGRPD